MTKDEFQHKYHNYNVKTLVEAEIEAEKVNKEAKGFTVEPMQFPGVGVCLMLKKSKDFVKELYPELGSPKKKQEKTE